MLGEIFKRYSDENLGRLIQEVDRLSQAPVKKFMVKDKEWPAHALVKLVGGFLVGSLKFYSARVAKANEGTKILHLWVETMKSTIRLFLKSEI